MSRKDALTELLNYFRRELSAVQSYLTPEQLNAEGNRDDWSPKDNLFHALAWAEKRLQMLVIISKGEPWTEPDYGDFTEINQEIFTQYQDRSWEDLQQMIQDTYQRGTAFVNQLSEDDLLKQKEGDERPYWRILADNFLNHPMIHVWEVLQASGQTGKLASMFGDSYAEKLRKLDNSDQWQGLIDYNQACLFALSSKPARAVTFLKSALKAVPQLIEWSKQDPDLDSIRSLPEYRELVEDTDSR